MSGPYEKLGGAFPLYILQFDRNGRCTSPQTASRVTDEVRRGDYTHIYLICHGWNNGFADATGLYRDFFNLFLGLRSKYAPAPAGEYRPVFIGLHWPSIILLLPWERGPRFAASDLGAAADASFVEVGELISESLDGGSVRRFYELTAKDRLTESEARELSAILRPIYRANALDTATDAAADVTDDGILASWMSLPDSDEPKAPPDYNVHGRAHGTPAGPIRAASVADLLDPRNAIRATTVLLMKDRAGMIGRFGLAPLLADLIPAARGAPFRLIGHSYGARVCLTALCSSEMKSHKASSLLLLQPAVNQYCFAASVPGLGLGVPGGFVPVFGRVGLPIFSTFSSKDIPLHTLFHLAARRIEDRGEIRFAAAGPSEFSALGGYGPDGIVPAQASKSETIHKAGEPYVFSERTELLALDGSDGRIGGHGDVRTEFTCWALLSQELANVL